MLRTYSWLIWSLSPLRNREIGIRSPCEMFTFYNPSENTLVLLSQKSKENPSRFLFNDIHDGTKTAEPVRKWFEGSPWWWTEGHESNAGSARIHRIDMNAGSCKMKQHKKVFQKTTSSKSTKFTRNFNGYAALVKKYQFLSTTTRCSHRTTDAAKVKRYGWAKRFCTIHQIHQIPCIAITNS